jgi:hypothetical protein
VNAPVPGQAPAIDLTRHHFMRELGDMVLFGSWVFNEDQEDTEPCLVILPRYRPPSSVKPCVIALSSAYLYDNPKYLVRAAKYIAEALGFEDSMTRTHKIADMIHSNLPDLVSMPVDPQEARVGAYATLEHSDGTKKTVELLEFEQISQI